ncbi:MAG: phospholipase D-like domain-containing protein [Candidatus Woesearchaeota archaeon]
MNKFPWFWTIVSLLILHACFLAFQPLAENVSYQSPAIYVNDSQIRFLSDITHNQTMDHEIFQTLFTYMNTSEQFLLTDMFLLSTNYDPNPDYLPVTQQLFAHLKDGPPTTILITDPLNTFYHSHSMPLIDQAIEQDVQVYFTVHSQLRPSNLLWSTLYYPFLQWIPKQGSGWISHPFGDPDQKVTARSFLSLLNFQANHRKVAVMDYQDTYTSFILSANPHNPSSLHSNIGFQIKSDAFAYHVLKTEAAIAPIDIEIPSPTQTQGEIGVQLLTEGKIRESLVFDIDATVAGDRINMAMFYFSDRHIVRALKRAADRGVLVTIVLDPSKDAFGREKNGVPNRQVAHELQNYSENIKVRWYDTQGEQFHSKMLVIRTNDVVIIHGGSANFTRRNIGDFNLETNVRILAPIDSAISRDVEHYFLTIYPFTLEYEAYEDSRLFLYWLYRFQEWSGLSTF